ncbi:CPXCG motif-containing cysteine-rich protein [Psychromonas sp. psych-6C06]|uniref:CPXCG motif-containing cysteine-rich protein n=1 Tax=Psychromonas sp. psych-6C06 TaxID=2058089 RepID=UPI000C33611D|nr:CPXCG motif-containing cysteine-rich protein [Psychromonas sp. psych-6C06]PKF60435.1 CPXCG motif-containing cysteine-rich protein [Psychromonas sp. psych-6C06]
MITLLAKLVLLDLADIDQQYIEDCQVCCKPIIFVLSASFNGEMQVNVCSEDDSF